MTGKLQHKTALITGAGRGIGRAIAERFACEGARVAVADIDPNAASATAAAIGSDALGLAMDVSSKAAVLAGTAQVLDQFGQLDILVNNAGYLVYTTFESCSEENWDRIVDVNMKGPFLCAQAVIPHMKARRQGVIINMTSLAAKTGGLAAGPPYAAAKAGVHTLTIGLARALAPDQIRVNAIAPGVIDTAMTAAPEHDQLKASIPLGCPGQPEDVASCALFLASDDARHITGETIDVNGGLYMD
ncbi:MAG: SDR family NAD(P)-dependent oxidoreductase [Gemmatimonadota bacterium]|nr:SDR family NAD(P)-dependent oxidoreductase [Gemmatimonadota bacterium]